MPANIGAMRFSNVSNFAPSGGCQTVSGRPPERLPNVRLERTLRGAVRQGPARNRVDWYSPSGHAELRCDLVEAWPPRSRQSVTDSLFHLGDCARPPEGFPALGAARLGPSNASAHALDNHAAFELGKHAHHLKHGLAGRRRGVDAISGFARAPGASLQNDLVNKYPREIGSTPLRSGTRAWVTSGRPREFRFPDRGIRGQHF